MSKYLFYPGCSLQRNARAYLDSTEAIRDDINIVLEEDAIDFIIEQMVASAIDLDDVYKKIEMDFEHGLKLARERTGRNRFFITRNAILSPEEFVSEMIKKN